MKKLFLVIPVLVGGALLWVTLDKEPPAAEAHARSEADSMSESPHSAAGSSTQRQPGRVENSSSTDSVGEQQHISNLEEPDVEAERFENPHQILSEVIVSGSVNQTTVDDLLSGEGFADLTAALRSEELTSEESMRNEEFKEFVVKRATSLNSDVTYDEMECGKSVCALSFRIDRGNGWKQFYNELTSDETHPTYVATGQESNHGGIYRLRLLVSIDPNVSSVVVPAPK